MSSFLLRFTALVSMVVDHAGLVLFPDISLMRCIGRLSFPIYCFLLVQGYAHTRDIAAYGRRLMLMALLSEIPFDMLIFAKPFSPMEQNVLFSLLLALAALRITDMLRDNPLYAGLTILALCSCAMAANVSYGWLGIALCLCMRCTAESRSRFAAYVSSMLALYSLTLLLSGVARSWVRVSLCSQLSLLPMLAYNGKKGLRHSAVTFAFYAAYPAHIILLVILRMIHIVPPGIL